LLVNSRGQFFNCYIFGYSSKGQFRTNAERKFVEDLIVYLDYKIREAERILLPFFSVDIISK